MIRTELQSAFDQTIKNGKFILADQVKSFEEEYARFHRTKFCIGVGNGHDAILISLKVLGVGKGDEVLVPSHTCQATWLAVVNCGADPVPVEVNPSTFTIDPEKIQAVITKKTKAIIPVHLYGNPSHLDEISAIAKKNKLSVIEDNAQAHGAVYKNKLTGTWGDCSATSFYPTKNLGALGDGGAILTNSKTLAALAKSFRNYGSSKKDVHAMIGINSRLDELQAALLRIKLKHLKAWNEMRRRNANLYFDQLKNLGDIVLPPAESKNAKPVFHQFVIQTKYRDQLKLYLEKKGIETAIHYPIPVHLQKAYQHLGYKKGSLPIAERLSKTVLSLPIVVGLKESEIDRVSEAIRKFFLK